MRPVPQHSTDLLYAGDFQQQDLLELGNALGVSDLKYITSATLKPEQVFYHACLNGVQTFVRLSSTDEVTRAKEIADITDQIYEELLPKFLQGCTDSTANLQNKRSEASHFCQQLEAIEGHSNWNATRYHNTWHTNDYPPRWQKKAIETYGIIKERIETGQYQLPEDKRVGDMTEYWSLRNLEYKHYRDISRSLIEDYIHQHLPKEKKLTMHPANERMMTMFIGGMGSGKSAMTEYYLRQSPEDERSDILLHNADYLKYALYRKAVRDGALAKNHQYIGSEVQAESSNALYEGTRKRGYLARQKFHAPNVVLNSIVLGDFEVKEGIASGGHIIAHHVHIPADEAIAEAEKRKAGVGGRIPSEGDIRWSAKASAQSLLLLTRPEFHGTDIVVHLYAREVGKPPRHYATIDNQHQKISIYNEAEFKKMTETAAVSADDQYDAFTQQFRNAGFTISNEKNYTNEVTSKQGVLYAAR